MYHGENFEIMTQYGEFGCIFLRNYAFKISHFLYKHNYKGVFKGGGSGGSNPPPPKFSDFFLKSEGKEIERKRKKRDVCVWGGGGVTS